MADDPSHDNMEEEKKKSRRPANTAFRQQRLKAWQPILTPKTVIPLFFAIGVICAPIGGLLIYASSTVKELQLDYTNCFSSAPNASFGFMPEGTVTSSFGDTPINAQWQRNPVSHMYNNYNVTGLTNCTLMFDIPKTMTAPVLFYYRLGNFYQNHRRYVASFFDQQLAGDSVTQQQVNGSDCDPLFWDDTYKKNYYPCGLIANSLFNDTFGQLVGLNTGSDSNETYPMSQTGIAWDSDKQLYKNVTVSDVWYDQFMPPPEWQPRWPNGQYSAEHPPPNLGEDEHLMVWMRTAGLPDFSKLYMRNDNDDLTTGTYQINIVSNFRTDVYDGTKSIVITTLSVMGGRNDFLGILWLVVGGICILLGVIFLITNLVKPRKLGDHTYLSWNNPASGNAKGKGKASGPSTGMATGRDLS